MEADVIVDSRGAGTLRGMKHTLLATAALALPLVAGAQTFNFQQGLNGYAGQFDTNLRGEEPTTVYGAEVEISVDASDGGFPSQGLIRFDNLFGSGAGQIGADQVIVSATLTLQITSAGSGFTVHEMLQPWNAATITWQSAGEGIQANGIEAASAALVSLGSNDSGANIGEGPLVIDFTEALQRVRSGAAPGLGWAFLPWLPDGTNGADFYSAEWATVGDRPLLTVVTAPVPEPATTATLLAGLALVARRWRRSAGSVAGCASN
jgi:hypothetical protein